MIKLRSLIRIFFYTEWVNFLFVKHKMFLLSCVSNTFSFFPLLLYYNHMLSDCGVCS